MPRPKSLPEPIRASGAVVWRNGKGRRVEVLIIHRPKYGDWSLPKGKRDPGETDEQCAVREVEEETGVRGRLGRELLPCSYVDRKGRPKVVRYWAMAARDEVPFTPNDEVDEVQWLSVSKAIGALSDERDVDVLRSFDAEAVARSA